MFRHILAPCCRLQQRGSKVELRSLIFQQYSTCTKSHQRLTYCEEPGEYKELCDLQDEKGGCWRKAGQWETPRPHRWRPDAKWSQRPLPFFPLSFSKRDALAVKWMDALKFPPALSEDKIQTLRPAVTLDALFASRRITLSLLFFTLLFTLIKATLPPTFKIDPGSYVASVGSTIAPTRVLNFPSDSKKKKGDHRVLSTIVWGNRRSPAPRSFPAPLSALQQRASIHSTTSNILTHFRKEILLTYSGSSIQVFSHFPLSFHSAVAPCAPPPLHSGPSSGFPPWGTRPVRECGSATAHLSPRWCLWECTLDERDRDRVMWLLKQRGGLWSCWREQSSKSAIIIRCFQTSWPPWG